MNVRESMTPDPAACAPDDDLDLVGEMMRQHRCGFIPVVDSHLDKRVIGVITDRDIALHLTRMNVLACQVPVECCMTKHPQMVEANADLTEAAHMMEQAAVHRLPVVDQGWLVGVLSLKDIARAASNEWSHLGPHVVEQQMKDVLEAIAVAHTTRRPSP